MGDGAEFVKTGDFTNWLFQQWAGIRAPSMEKNQRSPTRRLLCKGATSVPMIGSGSAFSHLKGVIGPSPHWPDTKVVGIIK